MTTSTTTTATIPADAATLVAEYRRNRSVMAVTPSQTQYDTLRERNSALRRQLWREFRVTAAQLKELCR